MNKLKMIVVAASALAIAGPAFASGAKLEPKASKSQGSAVGQASSSFTGNGAVIGGGTKGTGQTMTPGSRAQAVQKLHAADGRGRVNAKSR